MNNDQRHVKGVKASGTNFNVLFAMYVKCFKGGVCSFYVTLYTNLRYQKCTLHTGPLTPPTAETTIFKKSPVLWGYQFTILRRQLSFNFLGPVKLQG